MFKLEKLNLHYGKKHVLSNISLEINQGESVAVVGESASGKSTLMNHLYNLEPKQIAWCPQDATLVPSLSSFHNIYAGTLNEHNFLYNLRNLIHPNKVEFEKIKAIAVMLDLQHVLKSSVDQLSGGQKQRINIARAMIQKHSIFLGDEPVSAQDDFHKVKIIKSITASFNTSVFVFHDLDVALTCCERIIGLAKGKILFDEPVSKVTKKQLALVYSHHTSRLENLFI
ncbi:MAG: phosphonate transport system ATP-binding protein [Oleiphilaceae bacterium]|jgi:phosphonate transport system ATP-binding protein